MSFRLVLLKRMSGSTVCKIQERRLRGCRTRALAQLGDRRNRTSRLDPVANRAVDDRDFRGSQAVARVVFTAEPVLAQGRLELILLLELPRAIKMRTRRREHRALERDPVVRVVGRGLHGATIGGDGFVEIARACRGLPLAERFACCAPAITSVSASSIRALSAVSS